MFRLTFTSDSSIGGAGFAASYTASAQRSVALPSCSDRQKVRGGGMDFSWWNSGQSSFGYSPVVEGNGYSSSAVERAHFIHP